MSVSAWRISAGGNGVGLAARLRAGATALAGCRLCRRVTFAVFAAIVVVEAIILIPSYRNYERDLLASLVREGRAITVALCAPKEAGWGAADFLHAAGRLPDAAALVGGALYGADGRVAGTFGEAAAVAPDRTPARLDGEMRYEAAWDLTIDGARYRIVGRLDSSALPGELRAFVVRIAGLVLLIAVSVTAVAMVILDRVILAPLLSLHGNAVAAGEDADHPERHLSPIRRDDELGHLASAFNGMLKRIAVAMADLRQSRTDLLAATAEAQRANKAKSEFLANMSHELRTPLNAVIGFSEMMVMDANGGPGARGLSKERFAEYAGDIHDSGRYLLTLINDILDLSKAEAGELSLNEDDMLIGDAFDFARNMLAERAAKGGVALAVEAAPGLPVLRADPVRVRQMVLNLATNAVKFTPAGGMVTLRAALGGDGALAVEVEDTGDGIAEGDLARVLEPFGQAKTARSRAVEGTGLGLPLTRRLAEMHGASFALNSRLGEGTRVSVRFPAERSRPL